MRAFYTSLKNELNAGANCIYSLSKGDGVGLDTYQLLIEKKS